MDHQTERCCISTKPRSASVERLFARRLATGLACLVLGACLASRAGVARAEAGLSADIPPQPVASALAEFARQTGLQFIYISKLAKARTSKGARAGLAPDAALPALLEGTGLGYAFLNERTVRIFETSAPATAVLPARPQASRILQHGKVDEEIVVLGSRGTGDLLIAQELQNTPASVSIMSGDILEAHKLEQLSDYAAYLPGVSVAAYGAPGAAAVYFRGISTFTDAASASYYLDDTPLGASGPWAGSVNEALDVMPYDLEQLEVWRGPQGTHYGADAATGLIRFVLQAPSFDGLEARFGADGSLIQGAAKAGGSVRAMMNEPIVPEVLAMRVSGYDSYTPGYIDNAYNGARDVNPLRQTGVRAALLWRPTASLSVKLDGFWPRIHSDSEADISSTGVAIVPGTGDAYIVRPTGSYGNLTDNHAFLQPFRKSIDYYEATLHWAADPVEVDSATAWSRTSSNWVWDDTSSNGASFPAWSNGAVAAGLSAFHKNVSVEKFSEELRVVSPHDRRIEWLLGSFYTYETVSDQWALYAYDYSYQPIAYFAPVASLTLVHDTFNELAEFGELTWHLTARLDLSGGMRYAHTDQRFIATDSGVIDTPAVTVGQSAEGVTTWMGAASYRFTPDLMLYGRVATGSQPGSSNGTLAGVPPTVKPESITNYEVGVKSAFLEHRALVALTLYYINLNDIQLGDCFAGGCGLISGGDAVSKGMEFTASYSPVGGLKLALGTAYMQSQLTSLAPGAGPQANLTGYQLADVPRWSYALTADYLWALTNLWSADVGGAVHYIGARWSAAGVRRDVPTVEVPAYTLLDLNASITQAPIVLRLFARNVTDVRAISQAIVAGDPASPPAEAEQRILQPRTIGIGFDYTF